MTTATTAYKPIKVEYINPFVSATVTVFDTMAGTKLTRGQLYLKDHRQPDFEISGTIGLSGKAAGTVVLSLNRDMALHVSEALLGVRPDSLDADVVDAIGEMANMIAGSAKAKLEEFAMSISLPNVVMGKNHTVAFPSGITPIGIPFESEWGNISLTVGLCERTE